MVEYSFINVLIVAVSAYLIYRYGVFIGTKNTHQLYLKSVESTLSKLAASSVSIHIVKGGNGYQARRKDNDEVIADVPTLKDLREVLIEQGRSNKTNYMIYMDGPDDIKWNPNESV